MITLLIEKRRIENYLKSGLGMAGTCTTWSGISPVASFTISASDLLQPQEQCRALFICINAIAKGQVLETNANLLVILSIYIQEIQNNAVLYKAIFIELKNSSLIKSL
jgi:hypothetical protein